jgi:type VI secretion system secreted protein VgrG
MASAEPTLEAEFISPLGQGQLHFRRMHAHEALGRVPVYRIELLRETKRPPIEAKALLGLKATVQVMTGISTYRYFNGLVTRFERGGVVGRFDIYRLEMRPWLWQLNLGADCCIFQDKTAIEVIEAVFATYASAGQVEKKFTGALRKRPYTVQYRESDFNFVSRLLEEEGLYYYFKHTKDAHTLVLCNGPSGHAPIEGNDLAWSILQTDDQLREDVITQWGCVHALGSLKYAHTDYAADGPTVDLKADATRSTPYPKPNDLEVFDYPGGYDDGAMLPANTGKAAAEGKRLAQIQVDAMESGHIVASGVTPFRHTAPGFTFGFVDHVDKGGYLITSADYEMEFAGYEANTERVSQGFVCRFQAVPKTIRFMPEPSARRPMIHGPQTATVVGASGDEIHTDKFGRVKLQFRWDRIGKKDDKSSCWVRVSHPAASKQFGMVSLPRVGDEVVVEFLEGNPDRPLITGRVYNGDNLPPYTLPAQATVSGIKTQSSKGGALTDANELRFDDKKGSEYLWLQAQRDMHSWVKNDSFASVLNNYWGDVTKNYSLKIGGTADIAIAGVTKLQVDKDVSVKLGADLLAEVTGALGLKVSEAVAVKGEQAIAITSGQAMDLKVGQTLAMTATSSVSLKGLGIVIDGGTQVTIKAGSGTITLGPAGVTIDGALVKINSGGGGGAATPAQPAMPPAPLVPAEPLLNKDPLPVADGGSGANA